MNPTHATAECTGTWRLAGSGAQRSIRCTVCAANHPARAEQRRAAIEENRAGLILRRLTAEGMARLGSDGRH